MGEPRENFGDIIEKVMLASSAHDSGMIQLATLAVEYSAKTITAERFAERVVQILKTTGYVK